jgi:hypothetical protein
MNVVKLGGIQRVVLLGKTLFGKTFTFLAKTLCQQRYFLSLFLWF